MYSSLHVRESLVRYNCHLLFCCLVESVGTCCERLLEDSSGTLESDVLMLNFSEFGKDYIC